MPIKKHGVPSHPAEETKTDTLSFNKWPGWANYGAKENSLYLRICQLRNFLPKPVKSSDLMGNLFSERAELAFFMGSCSLSHILSRPCSFLLVLSPNS